MKYWDTSAILRAWKEGWVPESGFTRSHSISEWVSIQTGRGIMFDDGRGGSVKRAMSSLEAAKEARRMFAKLTFRDLTPAQTLEAMDALAKLPEVKGRAIHDFLHAYAAKVHKATSIVTLNLTDFVRMTSLRLEPPSKS